MQAAQNPHLDLQSDSGLRSILESVVVLEERAVRRHRRPDRPDHRRTPTSAGSASGSSRADDLDDADRHAQGRSRQLQAIYTRGGKTFEYQRAAAARRRRTSARFASASRRLLIRAEFQKQLQTPLLTAIAALVGATFVAMLLAQIVLRPIHVIRSGLARLGRGELDVSVDLPQDAELADLGDSFKQVTARLAADRTRARRTEGDARVGRRPARGRGRAVRAGRHAALRESRDGTVRSASDDRARSRRRCCRPIIRTARPSSATLSGRASRETLAAGATCPAPASGWS